jgi:hypothetical protein
MTEGWVASDATKNSLEDERPDWISLVSVAIAVSEIDSFDDEYNEVISEHTSRHDIPIQHPILKNKDLNRWCNEWERKTIRSDIISDLLKIEYIDTIQLIETSLHSEWVEVFSGEKHKQDRIRSKEFITKYLQPYYNIISIWEYLRKAEKRPRTHRNVLTDDFSGKLSPAWLQLGEMADAVNVVPKGDQTYPLLAFTDLLMEYTKNQVEEWNQREIYEAIRSETPDDSAYVDSDSIDSFEDLELIAPFKTKNVNTLPHYPHPIIFIDPGNLGQNGVTSCEFFKHATMYAHRNWGCVKFFEEHSDRDYLSGEDFLISMDGDTEKYSYLEKLNNERAPTIINVDEAKEIFHEELGL